MVFTRMSPRQTVSLVDTLLQLLFRFIVNTVSGAYLPRFYVGFDGLLRQHFSENVCSAFIIIIIIIIIIITGMINLQNGVQGQHHSDK